MRFDRYEDRANLADALEQMKAKGFSYLEKITAVDYKDHMEALYFLVDIEKNENELIKVRLENSSLWLPTVMELFKSADWYEREMAEMFGITIRGRKTERLLLEKWDGIDPPLRKSFVWGQEYRNREQKG